MRRRPVAIASAAWPPPCIPARAPWTVRTPAPGSSPSPTGGRWRCAVTGPPVHPGRAVRQGQPLPDAVTGPDRLTTPLVRVGAKGVGPVSYRPRAGTRRYGGSPAGCAPASTWTARVGPAVLLRRHHGVGAGLDDGPRLFAHLGASRLRTTICTAASRAALGSVYGGSVGFEPESVVEAKLIVLWGANLLSTNLHQWPFVREAQRVARTSSPSTPAYRHRGPQRRARGAAARHRRRPRPGVDAARARPGGVDRRVAAAHTVGWARLEARLDEWPVDRAAAECGLDVDAVRRARRADRHHPAHRHPGRARPATARRGRAGGPGHRALPLVTGDFRYPGGGALAPPAGTTVTRPPGGPARGMPAPPARSINMSRLAAALTGEADPPVTALVVFDTNPVATVPDQNRVRRDYPRRPVHHGAGATLDRHLRLRRRGAAGDDAARTPRPAHLLRSPLHDPESAGARPARAGAAEHRDLPADRGRAGAGPSPAARQRRGVGPAAARPAPRSASRSCGNGRTRVPPGWWWAPPRTPRAASPPRTGGPGSHDPHADRAGRRPAGRLHPAGRGAATRRWPDVPAGAVPRRAGSS